jgi:WD repeat-containing protein 90
MESLKKELENKIFHKDNQIKKPLLPDPIMELSFILGCTSSHCPYISFNSNSQFQTQINMNILSMPIDEQNYHKQIFYSSDNTLIRYDFQSFKQYFYFGHSKPITHYILAYNTDILFTAQEGPNAILRIWKTETTSCFKMLTTPYEKIVSMSCSRDNQTLATVGYEKNNKELVIVWDISNLNDIKVIVRQVSQSPMVCIKFSPFEQSIFLACGKENIKFWKIKGDHIGGNAVVLNKYARNTEFTCIDYNNPIYCGQITSGKAYIGSNTGCVFQINCSSQDLDAVYKVHDSSVLSICVNDTYCVTG